MIYAKLHPETLLDLRPYLDRVNMASHMLRVARDHRAHAEAVELIAVDHLNDAHRALSAEIVQLYPDLKGADFFLDANSGEITLAIKQK